MHPAAARLSIFLLRILKWLLYTSGTLGLIFLVLSFTDLPYYAYHWLGTSNAKLQQKPDLIVMLGGNGMPSPDGLIRSYYTAQAALENKNAQVIVALPYCENDSLRELNLARKELMMRGVDSARIAFEPLGFNTHSQAKNIAERFADKSKMTVLLVTSPEHMYRSVRTFLKAGFAKAGGMPTFEKPVDEEMVKDKDSAPGARVKNLSLRYNMWSYMNYELLALREYCAITYYKLKGWI